MHASTVLTIVAPVLLAGDAGEWISPDGAISISRPSPERFVEIDNPGASVVKAWLSKAGDVNIGVATIPNPTNTPLSQAGLEEGACKEINGTVITSEQKTLSGVPVYRMLVKGRVKGIDAHLMQAILSFNGQSYKLMASSPVGDVSRDADVQAVFNSLRILQPVRLAPSASAPRSANWFSQRIGGGALLTLIVLVPIALYRRRARKRATQSGTNNPAK